MIDASIPLQARGVSLSDMMQTGQQFAGMLQQGQDRKRLADLLPRAVHGDQSAIDDLYSVKPELAMRLDAQQKAAAEAKVADLTQAVRWADTPEKWDQVIQHYQAEGVDLSQYRGHFENRERALMELGKLGQYLSEAPKTEFHSVEAGGAGVAFDPHSGKTNVVIAPNDGSQPMGAPAGGAPHVTDQASYDAVPAGGQYMTPDGHMRVKGGQTQPASGNFPRSGYGF